MISAPPATTPTAPRLAVTPLATSRYQYAIVAAVTLLAALLRFHRLGEWSFWVDEALSVRDALATDSLAGGKFYPLFYLLIRPALLAFGASEWSARLVPALVSIATIPLLYPIVRRLFGTAIALLTAVLLALSPWQLYWAQNARFYSLLLLLFNLALFTFFWALETGQLRFLGAALVAWLLAMLTHPTAAFLLPVAGLYYLLLEQLPFGRRPTLRLTRLLPLAGLAGLALFAYDAARVLFLGMPWQVVRFLQVFMGRPNHEPLWLLFKVLYYVGFPLALLAVLGGGLLLRRRARVGLLLVVTALLPLGSLLALSPWFYTDIRYSFISAPAWLILGAVAIRELLVLARDRQRAWFVGGVTGVLILLLSKDPVVEDVLHFAHTPEVRLALLAATLGALLLLGGYRLAARGAASPQARWAQRGTLLWALGILLPVLLHPLLADLLYFGYQHGHRDDWRTVVAAISAGWQQGDVIYTSLPRLARHYLAGEVKYINLRQLQRDLAGGRRAWVVEELGVVMEEGEAGVAWLAQHCGAVRTLNNYAAGASFILRLHLCQPPGSP